MAILLEDLQEDDSISGDGIYKVLNEHCLNEKEHVQFFKDIKPTDTYDYNAIEVYSWLGY